VTRWSWLGLGLAVPPALAVTADADLWWHVLAGREILQTGVLPRVDDWSSTAAGLPWINHEWVPDLGLATAYDTFGNLGLLLLRAPILGLLVVAWLAVVLRRLPVPAAAVALVALPWPLLALLANLRPQTVTWALVPAVLWLADGALAGKRAAIWGLPLLILAWANLHGGFLFGWGLAGLALGIAALQPLPALARLERLASALTVAVVPALHPFGLAYPAYVLREIGADHPGLPEWNPPEGFMIVVWGAAVGMPLVFHLAARRWPEPVLAVAWAVAGLAALSAAKFIALSLILAPVLAAAPMADFLARVARDPKDALVPLLRQPVAAPAAMLVGMLLHLPLLPGWPGQIPVRPQVMPIEAIAWIQARGPDSGVVATPLGWGGLALYHLRPGWRVTLDGRNTTVYPVSFVHDQTRAWDEGDPSAILATDPDVIVAHTDRALVQALQNFGWKPVWRDETATVLAPPGSPLQPAPGVPVRPIFPAYSSTMTEIR
jgi:hypothetical protein